MPDQSVKIETALERKSRSMKCVGPERDGRDHPRYLDAACVRPHLPGDNTIAISSPWFAIGCELFNDCPVTLTDRRPARDGHFWAVVRGGSVQIFSATFGS